VRASPFVERADERAIDARFRAILHDAHAALEHRIEQFDRPFREAAIEDRINSREHPPLDAAMRRKGPLRAIPTGLPTRSRWRNR